MHKKPGHQQLFPSFLKNSVFMSCYFPKPIGIFVNTSAKRITDSFQYKVPNICLRNDVEAVGISDLSCNLLLMAENLKKKNAKTKPVYSAGVCFMSRMKSCSCCGFLH